MESIKSRKRGRKLEVSRSRQKSNKSKRERSPSVSSSKSSDSSKSNHCASLRRRSTGRDSKRKRVRSRSRSTDSSDQHSRKRKRRPSTTRAGTEKKKKSRKQRHKEHPIRRRARGSRQRYRRSVSISCSSCSCSDSSCSYSSDSCSTCSSFHRDSEESNRGRRQYTRSKKRSNHRGYSKEIKQRDGMKGQEEEGNRYKKGADELGIRSPNGKNVHERNGKVSSRSKAVRSPERVKTKKRIRNHLEESRSLSIPVGKNKKKVLPNYSNMDTSQSGKSFSCHAECNMEERVDEPKAENLELLLRQKALENLRKFRGGQVGMAEDLSNNKFEQPVCLGSKESAQTSYARWESTRTHDNNEFERDWKQLTIADRVLNEYHVDSRRDCQQSSSQRKENTFGSDMDLVSIHPSGPKETCTSTVLSSLPSVFGFHADCDANTASFVSEVDPSKPDTSEPISAHNDGNNDNKPVNIADKDSDTTRLNKHQTELEESSVKVFQDCNLKREIVSDNSASDALQVSTSKNKNSQTKLVKADRAKVESSKGDTSRTEMHRSVDFTTSSKNQSSGTEIIEDVEGTGEGPKEDASQTAIKESVDSTFQQKTMSVMRGGEMVQVSYKVYIPQRAATLAKRQLKR